MKIALIQLHATRDREDNIARRISALEEAAAQGAQSAAMRNKLSKLRAKGEKREDLYIGGRGVCAQRSCQRLSRSMTN